MAGLQNRIFGSVLAARTFSQYGVPKPEVGTFDDHTRKNPTGEHLVIFFPLLQISFHLFVRPLV